MQGHSPGHFKTIPHTSLHDQGRGSSCRLTPLDLRDRICCLNVFSGNCKLQSHGGKGFSFWSTLEHFVNCKPVPPGWLTEFQGVRLAQQIHLDEVAPDDTSLNDAGIRDKRAGSRVNEDKHALR